MCSLGNLNETFIMMLKSMKFFNYGLSVKRICCLLLTITLSGNGISQNTGFSSETSRWWMVAKDYTPVQPGEHPRLLFRKSDIPALRKKAESPEGKIMLKRLRYLLNGSDGTGMPKVYSPAMSAYSLGKNQSLVVDTPGVYTFGHIVGYGLLYQLTGDPLYADLGRQCFELALEGQRDRDDRYSWVSPGGALRAGPVLGWYAIGYDLCYDGWDEAAREKFGRAIEFYDSGLETRDAKAHVNLEALARGTMPPFSNHFGMQTGGAALALMAVSGEKWANQTRIDSLLKISEISMIRNVTEGFGDGGFFTEGDGTGSMASHIVYLTAIQAWKNAMGMDFINSGKPNIPMTALKWFYLTIVRDGKPEVWPVRGAYPHNVWDRKLSGGGYTGIGLGAVTEEQKKAVKWYYNRFLLQHDLAIGTMCEPGPYPHVLSAAFINWPSDQEEKNPAEVLPLCYRDSLHGFYAWRNQWKDERDMVITLLAKPSRGYMAAHADTAFQVLTSGGRWQWGRTGGDVVYWRPAGNGKTSLMKFSAGACVAIDFTESSGAPVMLVSTGEAEGEKVRLGNTVLTIWFPDTAIPPSLKVVDGMVKAGSQTIHMDHGMIIFGISE